MQCSGQRKQWHPTPVFLPGESQGQRSLMGCRLWVAQSQARLMWLSSSSSVVELTLYCNIFLWKTWGVKVEWLKLSPHGTLSSLFCARPLCCCIHVFLCSFIFLSMRVLLLLILILLFVMLCGLWDLSSPTSDWTWALCSEPPES